MRKFQQRYGLEYNRVMITLLFNESLCIDHWREKILLSPVLSCQDRTEIDSYVTWTFNYSSTFTRGFRQNIKYELSEEFRRWRIIARSVL